MSELRAQVALPEDLSWFPAPVLVTHSCRNSSWIQGDLTPWPFKAHTQRARTLCWSQGPYALCPQQTRSSCLSSVSQWMELHGPQGPLLGAWPEGRVWGEVTHTQLNSPNAECIQAQPPPPPTSCTVSSPGKRVPSPGEISNFLESVLSVKEGAHTSL